LKCRVIYVRNLSFGLKLRLIEFTQLHADPKLIGYMFTTWGVKKDALVDFPPMVEGLKLLRDERRP